MEVSYVEFANGKLVFTAIIHGKIKKFNGEIKESFGSKTIRFGSFFGNINNYIGSDENCASSEHDAIIELAKEYISAVYLNK